MMEIQKQEKKSIINTTTSPENRNPKREASPSSSPSHEFSFTIPLSSSSASSSSCSKPNPTLRTTGKTTSSTHQTDPSAVDLSPADEIFFHGHLLPLHLLSHLPVSPRTSTGSLDGFALPVKDILHDKPTPSYITTTTNNSSNNSLITKTTTNITNNSLIDKTGLVNGGKNKPIRSFSLFDLSKWRKGFEMKDRVEEEQEEDEERSKQQQQNGKKKKKKKKRLVSLDLSHALKKYIRMLFHRRENGTQLMRKRQAYSFSSPSTALMNSRYSNSNGYNVSYSSSKDSRGRRRRGDQFSAPASMRTSPTNSGHLRGISTTSSLNSCSSSNDSTMEELQSAIQAAIAHCKNSIAVHDRDIKINT